MRSFKVTLATVAVVTVAIGIVGVFASSRNNPEPPLDEKTPSVTVTLPDGTQIIALDPVGTSDGDFDPITIPDGVTSGIGLEIPESELTAPGGYNGPGDTVIANLHQSQALANPYALIVVDEFSNPLEGQQRAGAFAYAGFPDDGSRSVQTITLRIRQIAGSGSVSDWSLTRSIQPVNERLEPMTVVDKGCAPISSPLRGHHGSSSSTVRVCIYAFGSVNTPQQPVAAVQINTRLSGKAVRLFISSDKIIDQDVKGSHKHDEGYWWKIDPDTGLPMVDPETGEVIPADD